MFPTLFSTFFNFSGAQWYFQKNVRKKIYPKRAIGLNSFTKNTGDIYFFTMAEINEETCFECSQKQKMQKKIDVEFRIYKKRPTSNFFYIFFRIWCTISWIFVENSFLRPHLKGLIIPVILSPRTAVYECY